MSCVVTSTIAQRANGHVGRHRVLRAVKVSAEIDVSAGVGDNASGGGIAVAFFRNFLRCDFLSFKKFQGVTRDAGEWGCWSG